MPLFRLLIVQKIVKIIVQKNQLTSVLVLMASCLILTSCSTSYRLVLNDNVLYTPTGRAPPSLLSDTSLQGCLNQQFISAGHEDPANITLLACPSSGVQSLVGINALPNLEQLELSDNSIIDLSPLSSLRNLRVLSIRNNRITDINPLLPMPILRFVALQGNNRLPCRQLNELEKKIGNTLNRPASCIN